MTYCGVAAVCAEDRRAEEREALSEDLKRQRNTLIREGLYTMDEIDRIMSGDYEGIPSVEERQAEMKNGLILKKTRSVWVN